MFVKKENDIPHDYNIYKIISLFIDGNSTVKSLERYWIINQESIKYIKNSDVVLYKQLIDNFKKRKSEILHGKEKNNI